MDLFLLLLQIPIFVFLIRYIRKQHTHPLFLKFYFYLLSLKLTAGIVLGIIYFSYYKGGDTTIYYHDLTELSAVFYKDKISYLKLMMHEPIQLSNVRIHTFNQIRAYSFVQLLSPIFILTGSNYWILSAYLSLFCFAGCWFLSRILLEEFNLNPLAIILSFFIFPTFLFWSSGVLKESVAIGCICFLLGILFPIVHRKKKLQAKTFIYILLAFILFMLKFYYFAVLGAVILTYALVEYSSNRWQKAFKKTNSKVFYFIILLPLAAVLLSFLHPALHLTKIADMIYYNYLVTVKISNGHNVYIFERYNSSPASAIPYIPEALVHGLFGPYWWNSQKMISFFVSLENALLLSLFILWVIQQIKNWKTIQITLPLAALLSYVIVLAILMAFSSPNWGTLVRYKTGYISFFYLLVLQSNPILQWAENRFVFLKAPTTLS